MDTRITTCLMRDDVAGFLLAYRKLVSMDCDIIGIQTAYDRKNQRFVLTSELTQHFNKIACIGPVPIYEDYVTMANFPINVNFNDYIGNVFHMDIVNHLKEHHLDDIYPHQQTQYHPKLQVNKGVFLETKTHILANTLNVVINIFDPLHDSDFGLIYDVIFCLNHLQKQFGIPLTVYNAGIIHEDFVDRLQRGLEEEFDGVENIDLIHICGENLSKQLGYMLHSDIVISGSYGLGFLTYMVRTPSCIIYPYNLTDLMGKTIDRSRNTSSWYLETTDDDLGVNLDKITEITRSSYDRNRNSNV